MKVVLCPFSQYTLIEQLKLGDVLMRLLLSLLTWLLALTNLSHELLNTHTYGRSGQCMQLFEQEITLAYRIVTLSAFHISLPWTDLICSYIYSCVTLHLNVPAYLRRGYCTLLTVLIHKCDTNFMRNFLKKVDYESGICKKCMVTFFLHWHT